MLGVDRRRGVRRAAVRRCTIIEEWTAWCLVWERERELARGLRIKDAERSRATPRKDKVTRLPTSSPPAQSAPPPEGRKAA
jgi:hypothetical protein